VIPNDWGVKPLLTICEFQSGKAHEPYISDDGAFICVNSKFVSTEGTSRKFCTKNLSPTQRNDILMVMSDLPNGRALAKAFFVDDDGAYAVNQRVCILSAQTANPKFLFYLLNRNPLFLKHDDGVNQTHLSNALFTKFPTLIPPLLEQTQISRFLDHETARIDTLIEKQERLIALLKEKRQAVISHAVTKGLDPSVPMKDSGVEWLGEVPEHWSQSRIGWLCTVGNGCTPRRDDSRYWTDGDFPWLNSSTVNNERVSESDQFVTTTALSECALPIVPKNSVIMAITGEGKTRGTAAITEIDATINQHVAYMNCGTKRLDTEFLLLWLQSNYQRIRFESAGWGSTKAAVTCSDIRNYPIPMPPLNEQQAISAHIDKLKEKFDRLTSRAEVQVSLLKERRTALISAAVTGKIDVRNHPAANDIA
jgi:type I restriction enzyme S subunit